jgi:hypothetical protein
MRLVPATLLLTPRDISYRLTAARIGAVITNPDGMSKVGDFEGIRAKIPYLKELGLTAAQGEERGTRS